METPASMNLDATVEHVPASLPAALVDGLKIVENLKDKEESEELIHWLAQHPHLSAQLALFLAGEEILHGHVKHVLRADAVGSAVGKYELGELLGRGGMGIVNRAYDPVLKRDVALKRVAPGSYLSQDELARFRREAELAASLDHPNIVRVLDYGESKNGPYLVMNLMERSLADRLKSLGPDRLLPWNEAAEIIRDLALAIDQAHKLPHPLIHRDLKPANILLDQKNRPHVADFGLARQLDASITTGVAGTYSYMAPEQVRGDKDLTPAVDIHALGAILFELLMGSPPFGTGDIPTLISFIKDQPVPPIRDLRPDVPRDLERVCQKCLAKHAVDRYASGQALADDLNRVLKNEHVPTHGTSLLRGILRAIERRHNPLSMTTWPIAFWGTAWSLAGVGAIQASVLLDGPSGLQLGLLLAYFVGWITIVWVYFGSKRDALNPVEYGSLAIHLGMFFASIPLVCTQLWIHDGDVLYVFPPLGALLGLTVFVHGLNYWGRLYLIGLFAIIISGAMPLVPKMYWPSVYCVTVAGCQLWAGIVLHRYQRNLSARRTAIANSSQPPPS